MTGAEPHAEAVRGLRASLYSGTRGRSEGTIRTSPLAFRLVLLAVTCEFCISGNTLDQMGISYSTLGGSPFVKFLPATYLAIFGAVTSLNSRQGGLGHLFSRAPALLLYCALMVFCAIFAAANVGLTGVGVYIDTFISAGALAIIMVNASARQRAILARLVLAFCVINVLISLAEYVHQEHFIPLTFTNELGNAFSDNQSNEFRPAALYAHPLTGAMATAFGIFLVLAMNLRFVTTGACFVILSVGLLAFGGRAALLVTVSLLLLRVFVTFVRDMIKWRRVNGRLLGVLALAILVLGPLFGFLLTATPVGQRIAARAYYDDSAEVRADQWRVFERLNIEQAMFGTPAAALDSIYAQIGLEGIENPFILVFLNLGIVGVPFFSGGLLAYFLYIRRAYPDSGWLLGAALLILSTSNSIGTKSPDLFMMTACAVSMKSYGRLGLIKVARRLRPTMHFPHLLPKELSPEASTGRPMMAIANKDRGLSPYVVRKPDSN